MSLDSDCKYACDLLRVHNKNHRSVILSDACNDDVKKQLDELEIDIQEFEVSVVNNNDDDNVPDSSLASALASSSSSAAAASSLSRASVNHIRSRSSLLIQTPVVLHQRLSSAPSVSSAMQRSAPSVSSAMQRTANFINAPGTLEWGRSVPKKQRTKD